ncbi:MAG TPA: twin-arginine translocase subunit TatC [Actinomycetota bacterium]|nr:twin-arginine translocase subunit TatC [Actinomycetota bacterium]
MTVIEHLTELRRRLVISLATFVGVSVVAFLFFEPITDFLLRPLCALPADRLGPQGCRLVFTGPLEPFLVRLKVTALVGLVGASPIWLYQLWAFVAPGLTAKEKRYAVPFVVTSVALFLVGAAIAYLSLKLGLKFLLALGGENFVPFLRADSYLTFLALVLLGFGVTFELPLLLFFLGLAGIVSVEQLRRQRKIAFVGAFAIAAVVTPTQDPYTMTGMAVPLYALYEVVIGLLSLRARRASRRAQKAGRAA